MKKITLLLFIGLTATTFAQKKKIQLEEIYASWKFNADRLQGLRSMNDGTHYTSLETERGGSAIVKYSYKTGEKVEVILKSQDLIPGGKTEPIEIEEYQFSADESKILIANNIENIYRHSTRENYYVYDRKTEKLTAIGDDKKLRYATFSPKGNKVAYVKENNLFVEDLEKNTFAQITKDGKFNEIINGATDWVYEEEFAFDKAFFWSNDGEKIAYYKFDESKVKEFSMPTYGSLYTDPYKFKYPKAGEDNSKVSIYIYNVSDRTNIQVKLGNEFEYIPRIKWTNDSDLLTVFRMNRHQNKLELLLALAPNGTVQEMYTETSDTYLEIHNNLTYLKDKKQFIWTSEKDGFNHIYLMDMNGKVVKQLTQGDWDVSNFIGVDEEEGKVYYVSSEESPLERHVYSVGLDGKKKKQLTKKEGWNTPTFSKSFKYFINNHSDANTPTYITLHDASGKEIRTLIDNQKLNKALEEYDIAEKEFFTIENSSGTELNAWMIKPNDFDDEKKYPVLMYVYGGPGSQTVQNSWDRNMLWYQHLAQKGYIVVSVDNRGTGARGYKFRTDTYKQLGKLETEDQIDAGTYLANLPYVDKDRIGIWGWSYGGYMSSLALTKGNSVFKMAIAVAPVTNWRYYDSIYTERYMQTPQENPDGYDDNSPINHVDKLKGKYLLIHGTADDNVHYQNAVEMVDALIAQNQKFDVMFYPNRNHGIYGGVTRLHLYTLMTDFIDENL